MNLVNTDDSKLLLLGCGILKKEIEFLIFKNQWPLETHFLDSALHIDVKELGRQLSVALELHQARQPLVFYGACHPLMDDMLTAYNTNRIPGQNCVDILLGREHFERELKKGAFFLLEEWSLRWQEILIKTFGNYPKVIKEIFQLDRRYLLALRTPCSNDFSVQAEIAAEMVGLPLQWQDVSLDVLEANLNTAIQQKLQNF